MPIEVVYECYYCKITENVEKCEDCGNMVCCRSTCAVQYDRWTQVDFALCLECVEDDL